jgi:hypothetical protein
MAIGRISGPMLLPNLERQGVDLSIDGNLLYFDVTNRTITVGNTIQLYSLPNTAPPPVRSLLYAEGYPSLKTYWAPAPQIYNVGRERYEVTIPSLLGYGNANIDLPLGVSSIVYDLTVSRPGIKVEVFGRVSRDEDNPYTFISSVNHLTDDGTVIMSDGSSFQSRQYSIFANLEDPPAANVYATVTSISNQGAGQPVTLSFYYFRAVPG